MSDTASGAGSAGDAVAVTGPAAPTHLEVAAALLDVRHHEDIVAAAERKAARARDQAVILVADAEQAIADAQADREVSRDRLARLAPDKGTLDAAVAALAAEAKRARQRFEQVRDLAGGV
jgi:hypothetical protein